MPPLDLNTTNNKVTTHKVLEKPDDNLGDEFSDTTLIKPPIDSYSPTSAFGLAPPQETSTGLVPYFRDPSPLPIDNSKPLVIGDDDEKASGATAKNIQYAQNPSAQALGDKQLYLLSFSLSYLPEISPATVATLDSYNIYTVGELLQNQNPIASDLQAWNGEIHPALINLGIPIPLASESLVAWDDVKNLQEFNHYMSGRNGKIDLTRATELAWKQYANKKEGWKELVTQNVFLATRGKYAQPFRSIHQIIRSTIQTTETVSFLEDLVAHTLNKPRPSAQDLQAVHWINELLVNPRQPHFLQNYYQLFVKSAVMGEHPTAILISEGISRVHKSSNPKDVRHYSDSSKLTTAPNVTYLIDYANAQHNKSENPDWEKRAQTSLTEFVLDCADKKEWKILDIMAQHMVDTKVPGGEALLKFYQQIQSENHQGAMEHLEKNHKSINSDIITSKHYTLAFRKALEGLGKTPSLPQVMELVESSFQKHGFPARQGSEIMNTFFNSQIGREGSLISSADLEKFQETKKPGNFWSNIVVRSYLKGRTTQQTKDTVPISERNPHIPPESFPRTPSGVTNVLDSTTLEKIIRANDKAIIDNFLKNEAEISHLRDDILKKVSEKRQTGDQGKLPELMPEVLKQVGAPHKYVEAFNQSFEKDRNRIERKIKLHKNNGKKRGIR